MIVVGLLLSRRGGGADALEPAAALSGAPDDPRTGGRRVADRPRAAAPADDPAPNDASTNAALAGRVRDESGTAVAGATVRANPVVVSGVASDASALVAQTDAEGEFRIETPNSGVFELTTSAPGLADGGGPCVVVAPGRVEIVLRAVRRVGVRVRDARGAVVLGATVAMRREWATAQSLRGPSALTGTDGIASVEMGGGAGHWLLGVEIPGRPLYEVSVTPPADAGPHDIVVPDTREVRILVVDGVGEPVAGCHVTLNLPERTWAGPGGGMYAYWPAGRALGTSDAEGVLRAQMYPGLPGWVSARHAGRGQSSYPWYRGDDSEQVTLRLCAEATLTGRVVDQAGVPVAGAEVAASWGIRPFERRSVLSGRDGRFCLEGLPLRGSDDRIRVKVRSPAWTAERGAFLGLNRPEVQIVVDAAPGEREIGDIVAATADAEFGALLRVVDSDGRPVSATCAVVGPDNSLCFAGDDGVVPIRGVGPDTDSADGTASSWVSLRAPGFAPAGIRVPVRTGTHPVQEMRLMRGATIHGVVLGPGGEAMVGANVTASWAQEFAGSKVDGRLHSRTDECGRFRLDGVPAGATIRASSVDGDATVSVAEDVTRTSAPPLVVIRLSGAARPGIRGIVADAHSGLLVGDCAVTASNADRTRRTATSRFPAGSFRFDRLELGEWRVAAAPSGGTGHEVRANVEPTASAAVRLEVALPRQVRGALAVDHATLGSAPRLVLAPVNGLPDGGARCDLTSGSDSFSLAVPGPGRYVASIEGSDAGASTRRLVATEPVVVGTGMEPTDAGVLRFLPSGRLVVAAPPEWEGDAGAPAWDCEIRAEGSAIVWSRASVKQDAALAVDLPAADYEIVARRGEQRLSGRARVVAGETTTVTPGGR